MAALWKIILFLVMTCLPAKSTSATSSVCMTPDCQKAADEMLQFIDSNVDPCEDFPKFVCGSFQRNNKIPKDSSVFFIGSDIEKKRNKFFKDKLSAQSQPGDPDYLKKMSSFYQACMNESKIDSFGLKHYVKSQERKEWLTISSKGTKPLDFQTLVEKYEGQFTEGLFQYRVDTNLSNSAVYAFTIKQAKLTFEIGQLRKQARNDTTTLAYEKYYVDIAVLLGAERAIAEKDAKDLVNFEIELDKALMTSAEEDNDKGAVNNPMTLRELSNKFRYLDWVRVVRAIFSSTNITINEDLVVNAYHYKYLEKLDSILNNTDKRVIQNRMSFKYATRFLQEANNEMRKKHFEFKKVLRGVKKRESRENECYKKTDQFFSMGLGKLYVDNKFNHASKKIIDDIVINVENAFKERLRMIQWMGNKTKEAAFKKLSYMKKDIGYPDSKFDTKDLNELYKQSEIKDTFYETFVGLTLEKKRRSLRRLFQSVDRSEWAKSPHEVNAYYHREKNTIMFLAAALQPVVFSEKYPSSLNYGGAGFFVGHEIIHGFDIGGSAYDELGSLKNWWKEDDKMKFRNKTQCLIDQYSQFVDTQVNLTVDGKKSLSENIGDNGGINQAFRAYQKISHNELPLPKLNLTVEQQFFVAAGRVFCYLMTDAFLRNRIFGSNYAPPKFRIRGMTQNSEHFSRAFNCARHSSMNPAKKCVVW